MKKQLYPKLSEVGAIYAGWNRTQPTDPDRKSDTRMFYGLVKSESDPPDLWITSMIHAAIHLFENWAEFPSPSILPQEVSARVGRELTLNEYLTEIQLMGLDLEQLKIETEKWKNSSIESEENRKAAAVTFFELIKTEWYVSTKQVHQYLDGRSIYEFLELVLAHADATRARVRAVRGHQKTNGAKDFVRSEWGKNRADYKNNKSAFARDYCRRVKRELDVDVTEKTIREVWLSDTPAAGKPAG